MKRSLPLVTLAILLTACVPGRFKPPVTEGTFIHDPLTHRIDGGIPGTTTNRAFTTLPSITVTPATPLLGRDAEAFRRLVADLIQHAVEAGQPRVLTVSFGDTIDYSIADSSGKVLESSSMRNDGDIDASARFVANRVIASK